MIFKHSRYTNTDVYIREDGNKAFKKRTYSSFNPEDSSLHVWKEGDTLDGLAYKFYGDSQLWWVIADANINYIPFGIPYGAELVIPSREWVMEQYG